MLSNQMHCEKQTSSQTYQYEHLLMHFLRCAYSIGAWRAMQI